MYNLNISKYREYNGKKRNKYIYTRQHLTKMMIKRNKKIKMNILE